MKKYMKCMALATLAMVSTTSASAAVLINGSFEMGTDPGSFTTVGTGQTNITGWTVAGDGGVDYIGSYWQAADGVRSIDLSGNGPGSVAQTIATIVGQKYKVNFSLAGNPDGGAALKILVSSIGGTEPQISTFSTTGASRTAMNWTPETYVFTAFGAFSTLTFASANNSPYGPAIDNVSIAAVPEPATWAMMLAGFCMMGFGLRRRSHAKQIVRYV